MGAELDLDDVCAGNPKAQEELKQLREERDLWKRRAGAMRRWMGSSLGIHVPFTSDDEAED